MQQDNSRNTILFVILAVAMLFAYQFFVMRPAQERQAAAQRDAAEALATGRPIPGAPLSPATSIFVDRAQALAASPRVTIDTPALRGSVNLRGARIDDLFLKDYRQAVSRDAPPVELFRPEGAQEAYFAEVGWTGAAGLPGPDATWTQTGGSRLAPGQPVTLTWAGPQGVSVNRTIAVDDRYMFTVTDTVVNRGPAPIQIAPYASVQRQGIDPTLGNNAILHEGAVGMLGDRLKLIKFKPWREKGGETLASTGGWLGVTDKYWLAAVIPHQQEKVQGQFRVTKVQGVDVYEANFVGTARALAPGMQTTDTVRVFAGAKKVSVLRDYEKNAGVTQLDQAVDWGNFWFLTRPLFDVLSFYQGMIGSFALALLLLTVTVRLFMFPLANKSYESMTKMRKLQPQMEEIKKRFDKDPQKQQQEMMALYQREKVNPLAGCFPMLLQIPVFFALYKVLFVTLEMRHAPFYGWIHDLSAPDPTTWLNLFGLIPWDPAMTPVIGGILGGFLHIGVWPLLYGFTMWLTTTMTPAPSTDPTQKMIMQLMPIILTFTLGRMAVGLIIYWTWSNVLTIVQQYVIARKFGVENPIDNALAKLRGGKA
jgi:YidC/Oxa1 family membrane protein insertase